MPFDPYGEKDGIFNNNVECDTRHGTIFLFFESYTVILSDDVPHRAQPRPNVSCARYFYVNFIQYEKSHPMTSARMPDIF